jgi:hypothetical protein
MKKKLLILCSIIFLWNCEAIFVENISDENVTLLAPTNNIEVAKGLIQFNWEEVVDATEYRIQIATPDFVNTAQVVLDSIVTSTVFSKDLDVGEYQWRVKASNSGYETAYTSLSFSVN